MSLDTARLERNAKGVWEIRWSEKGADRHYSKRLSTRTNNRLEAEAVFTGFLTGQRHIEETLLQPTINDLIARYKSSLESKGVTKSQHVYLGFISREFGELRIAELTDVRLESYKRRRRVSDGSMRRELGAFRAVFSYAERHKLIKRDEVPYIELPRSSAPREAYLNDEEERAFHAAALALSDGLPRLTKLSRFVVIALNTAARKTAIERLRWDQVDLVAGHINFSQQGEQAHNKRKALVPISKRLMPLMQRMYAEKKSDYVLDAPTDIRKAYEVWARATPWSHINPHDLRRTFATLAAQRGVPLVAIAEVLGDSVGIVMKHYAKYIPGAAKAAVDARED